MGLDIRLPIGLMFATFAPILVVTGVTTQTPINLYSGAAMGVFGAIMLLLTYRARSST
jgi:hypothetical protein